MYNFVFNLNEIPCRKRGRIELDHVRSTQNGTTTITLKLCTGGGLRWFFWRSMKVGWTRKNLMLWTHFTPLLVYEHVRMAYGVVITNLRYTVFCFNTCTIRGKMECPKWQLNPSEATSTKTYLRTRRIHLAQIYPHFIHHQHGVPPWCRLLWEPRLIRSQSTH